MTARPPLDTFETALLARLRAEVEHGAPDRSDRLVRSRRRWWAPAVLALAGVLAAVLGARVLLPVPAFAVTGTNDSTVVVKVSRLEGADALERALAERGIASDVTYLPPGKRCAPGRYVEADTRGLSVEIGVDRFKVTLRPHTVGPEHTFVLSAAVTPLDRGVQVVVSYGVALGPVAPCRVVDAG